MDPYLEAVERWMATSEYTFGTLELPSDDALLARQRALQAIQAAIGKLERVVTLDRQVMWLDAVQWFDVMLGKRDVCAASAADVMVALDAATRMHLGKTLVEFVELYYAAVEDGARGPPEPFFPAVLGVEDRELLEELRGRHGDVAARVSGFFRFVPRASTWLEALWLRFNLVTGQAYSDVLQNLRLMSMHMAEVVTWMMPPQSTCHVSDLATGMFCAALLGSDVFPAQRLQPADVSADLWKHRVSALQPLTVNVGYTGSVMDSAHSVLIMLLACGCPQRQVVKSTSIAVDAFLVACANMEAP